MHPSFDPPILSYEDINNLAESFLKEHNTENKIPVPIEEIVEFYFGIDIVPVPGLQVDYDTDGFISGDLTTIFVDDYIYNNRPFRYRFTLAHEIGHLVIHKNLLKSYYPKSIDDWAEFIHEINQEQYSWFEWQAYAFAGLTLVPRKLLVKHFAEQIEKLASKIELVKSSQTRESYRDYIVEIIALKLQKHYEVSIGALTRRISKEIEKGEINIP